MDLITPGLGLLFWMTLTFLILVWALRRFAWGPILKMLKAREDSISSALTAADKARQEMQDLTASNEAILREARAQSQELLIEAEAMKKQLVADARVQAQSEYQRLLGKAKIDIENEKTAAMVELRNEVALLSLEIAQRILREELSDPRRHEALIRRSMEEYETK